MSQGQVKIGKNIIEILTTGMYDNPLVIFREYVQNSVDAINQALEVGHFDSIDDGEVHILIDATNRRIEIHDNATGISSKKAWNLLTSVAASTKDRTKHLGFRGIGRLAGLAYCENLTIETSSRGEEVKSKLVWDGNELRKIIVGQKDTREAHEVIEAITTFQQDLPEEINKGYFTIILENVKNDKLLNTNEVKKYLRMVAPVPFKPQFIYGHKITEELENMGLSIGSYRVYVDHEAIHKPYRTRIYKGDNRTEKSVDEIIDTPFFEINDPATGHPLAIGWYSITTYMQRIPVYNEPYGIRLRKGNIQIGDQYTLQRFFTDERFHKYFVGEVHVVSNELTPNGQRDYFDESDTLSVFEGKMRELSIKLSRLCHDASKINSSFSKIETLAREKQSFNEKQNKGEFLSPSHEKDASAKIEQLEDDADNSRDQLKKIERKAVEDSALDRILEQRRKKSQFKINETENVSGTEDKSSNGKKSKKYKSQQLSQLNRKEQKLVGDIYEIIRTILSPDLANNLIFKIEEKFGNKASDKN